MFVRGPVSGFAIWGTRNCAANPSLTGKANLSVNGMYHKGATTPTGQTKFQFKVSNLNFHSTRYDWLMIVGNKAQYKGSGTINGNGDHGSWLTTMNGSPDKVTGTIIYDNQMGAPDGADATEFGRQHCDLQIAFNLQHNGAGQTSPPFLFDGLALQKDVDLAASEYN